MLTQVVEAGLGHLPFRERTVTTPTGHQYVGVDFAKKLCGVSIIRRCAPSRLGKRMVRVWHVSSGSGHIL